MIGLLETTPVEGETPHQYAARIVDDGVDEWLCRKAISTYFGMK